MIEIEEVKEEMKDSRFDMNPPIINSSMQHLKLVKTNFKNKANFKSFAGGSPDDKDNLDSEKDDTEDRWDEHIAKSMPLDHFVLSPILSQLSNQAKIQQIIEESRFEQDEDHKFVLKEVEDEPKEYTGLV